MAFKTPEMTSYPITMRTGAVVGGRPELAEAFRALPDGNYTLTIAPVGDPIAAISEIVGWYGALSETERQDPNLLGVLIEKAALLSTLCFALAQQVAVAVEREKAEGSAVKAQRVVLIHGYQQEAEASDKKLSDAAAGRKADYELLEQQKDADLSDRIASVLVEHLRAAKEVLGVIKMNHIPALRDERGQR